MVIYKEINIINNISVCLQILLVYLKTLLVYLKTLNIYRKKNAINGKKEMIAMILTGGQGSRLKELTKISTKS